MVISGNNDKIFKIITTIKYNYYNYLIISNILDYSYSIKSFLL